MPVVVKSSAIVMLLSQRYYSILCCFIWSFWQIAQFWL